MPHPMAIEELQEDEAVDEPQDDEGAAQPRDDAAAAAPSDDRALEELADDEIAAPLLAAIQHSYEEAMASIDDLARFPWSAEQDGTDPHPGTEKIDLRLIKPPTVTTPPTASMSLAARCLAEQTPTDVVRSSNAERGTRAHRHRAPAGQEPAVQAGHDSPDRTAAPRRRSRLVAAVISRWLPGSAVLHPSGA